MSYESPLTKPASSNSSGGGGYRSSLIEQSIQEPIGKPVKRYFSTPSADFNLIAEFSLKSPQIQFTFNPQYPSRMVFIPRDPEIVKFETISWEESTTEQLSSSSPLFSSLSAVNTTPSSPNGLYCPPRSAHCAAGTSQASSPSEFGSPPTKTVGGLDSPVASPSADAATRLGANSTRRKSVAIGPSVGPIRPAVGFFVFSFCNLLVIEPANLEFRRAWTTLTNGSSTISPSRNISSSSTTSSSSPSSWDSFSSSSSLKEPFEKSRFILTQEISLNSRISCVSLCTPAVNQDEKFSLLVANETGQILLISVNRKLFEENKMNGINSLSFPTNSQPKVKSIDHKTINKNGVYETKKVTAISVVPHSLTDSGRYDGTVCLAGFSNGKIYQFSFNRRDYDAESEKDANPDLKLPSPSGTHVYFQNPLAFVNPVSIWKLCDGAIHAICFSASKEYVAIACSDGVLRIFDWETRTMKIGFRSYYGAVLAVDWSPDDRLIAMGGESDCIEVWNFKTLQFVARGFGHRSWVTSIKFDRWEDPTNTLLTNGNRNGQSIAYRIASACFGQKLLVWEFSEDSVIPPQTSSSLSFSSFPKSWSSSSSSSSGPSADLKRSSSSALPISRSQSNEELPNQEKTTSCKRISIGSKPSASIKNAMVFYEKNHILIPPERKEAPTIEPVASHRGDCDPLISASWTPGGLATCNVFGRLKHWKQS